VISFEYRNSPKGPQQSGMTDIFSIPGKPSTPSIIHDTIATTPGSLSASLRRCSHANADSSQCQHGLLFAKPYTDSVPAVGRRSARRACLGRLALILLRMTSNSPGSRHTDGVHKLRTAGDLQIHCFQVSHTCPFHLPSGRLQLVTGPIGALQVHWQQPKRRLTPTGPRCGETGRVDGRHLLSQVSDVPSRCSLSLPGGVDRLRYCSVLKARRVCGGVGCMKPLSTGKPPLTLKPKGEKAVTIT